jgi:hypothetical protein
MECSEEFEEGSQNLGYMSFIALVLVLLIYFQECALHNVVMLQRDVASSMIYL